LSLIIDFNFRPCCFSGFISSFNQWFMEGSIA